MQTHNLADLTPKFVAEKKPPAFCGAEFEKEPSAIASADTPHERALLAAITAGQHIDADDTKSFLIGAEVDSIACDYTFVRMGLRTAHTYARLLFVVVLHAANPVDGRTSHSGHSQCITYYESERPDHL